MLNEADTPTKSSWPAESVEMRTASDLIPYANNARTHSEAQVKQVAASIREWGWTIPILVDENDSIIAGHCRIMAANLLKIEKVPVMVAKGWSDTQKKAYILADNKLALNAGWDDDLLKIEIAELKDADFDIGLTGFDIGELDIITHVEVDPDAEAPDPEVPEVPSEPITKPGDIIKLGEHTLVCGDCRDVNVVKALLGDDKVDVAFTSPPYASQRKYDDTSGFKPIRPDDYVDWFEAVQASVASVLDSKGSWFVNIKEHCEDGQRSLYVNDLTIAHVRSWGWRYIDSLCWTHGGFPISNAGRFKNAWEPILHFNFEKGGTFNPTAVGTLSDGCMAKGTAAGGNRNEFGGIIVGKEPTKGIARPSNVLNLSTNIDKVAHSAPFPASLPSFFIKAFSNPGDIIFDPFMGSGTTIIASENLDRVCYGVEISPGYCDVIVERWENHTGKKAVR